MHAAAREGCLDVLQYLYGAGFDMTGETAQGLLSAAATCPVDGWPVSHCVLHARHRLRGRAAHAARPMLVQPRPLSHLPTRIPTPGPLAELDSERKSPLHHAPIGCGQAALAARRGADHRAAAEVLLAAGCRVDAQDTHGCTPLHFAAGGARGGQGSAAVEAAGGMPGPGHL